jgi:uncharacterized protein (TIGR02246 family)
MSEPIAVPAATATPRQLMATFVERLQAGDLKGLQALYAVDAVFVPEPGVALQGISAIRPALAGLLALRPTMETHIEAIHQAADIALVIVTWSMRGTAPEGAAVVRSGRSADVLRQRDDGRWEVLIDHP